MIPYLLKRILFFIPMVLLLILIVFWIMDFTPGDPARLILGERAGEAQLAMMRESLGLNDPFWIRYGRYVFRLFTQGDWGTSYRTRTAVITDILRKFPYTLRLAVLSILGSSLIGVSLGVLSAAKPYTSLDRIATALSLALSSIPGFWLGMTLILIFSLRLGILPSNGASSWRHFVLPSLALIFPGSGGILRLTRAMLLETLGQDYIRTARAKGVGEGDVFLKHAMKNAAPPLITAIGMRFGYLLGGAVIAETVFAIPGLGSHMVDAIRMKDAPVALAATVFLSIFYCLLMALIDIASAILDPRIRGKLAG